MKNDTQKQSMPRHAAAILFTTVLISGACGIFYELLISTVSSYFLGSSILHFSLTIGLFLFFMGVGSYFSRFLTKDLVKRFIEIELLIALLGGFSVTILYFAFSLSQMYYVYLFFMIASISTLIGLEIPLVAQLLKDKYTLKDVIGNVLSFDYVGALVASILFPLLLLPFLGLMRTAFIIGFLNLLIALVCLYVFKTQISSFRRYVALFVVACVSMIGGFVYSNSITSFFEDTIYQDEIIYTKDTPYQRIVLTSFKDDLRLYLNGNLQFSSKDEYRYHESLVHVPMSLIDNKEHVLVLGGGDGLVARELLKYPDVKKITIVDIDKAMTDISKTHPRLVEMNKGALSDPRVELVHQDAFTYVQDSSDLYAAVIIDLPDPTDTSISRMYTTQFYATLQKRLAYDGVVVTQASSPYFARRAFWTVATTMEESFDWVAPYTVHVPSFGQWGFVMGRNVVSDTNDVHVTVPVRYLSSDVSPTLFIFDTDTARVETEVNSLDTHALIQEYEKGWDEFHS